MTRAVFRAVCLTLAGLTLAGCVPRPVRIEAQASAAVASASDVAAGEALFPVQSVDGLWGYADPAGRLVVPVLYADAGPFAEGRARVAVRDGTSRRYGFVAPDGTVVVAPTLIDATVYGDGLTVVRRQTPLSGVQRFLSRLGGPASRTELLALDRSGGIALELPQREVLAFAEGRAPFRGARARWGFLDTRGRIAISPTFDGPGFLFSEGLARVSVGGRLGFADTTGAVVVAPAYDAAGPFSEGLAAVSVGGRWGYVDRTGRTVVDPRFDEAGVFSEGLALVRQDSLYGYIDRTGAVVIAPQFRAAQAFRGGRAVAVDGRRSVLLTPTGVRVAPGTQVRP